MNFSNNMSHYAITIYPAPILKNKAKEVREVTLEIKKIIGAMEKVMEEHDGVGIAAPQIGIPERIIIVKNSVGNHAFLNPVIVKRSKKQITDEEGCLSLPEIFVKIKRAEEVEVMCQTLKGETVKIKAKGIGARIFQHEIDHLNGVLIINKISALARFKLRKQLRELTTTHPASHSTRVA